MPTSQAAPNVTALNAVTALSNPNGLLISRNRNTLRGHFSISNHIKNLIEPLDRENSAHHFDIYFVFVALKAKAVKIFKEKLITTVTSSGHYVIHLTANFQYSS